MRTNLLWSYGAQGAGISAVVAAVGLFISNRLGGWDQMVQALVIFMAVDVLLGLLAAFKNRQVDSHAMFWGGINKILVLAVVALGVVLDGVLGLPQPYIRTASIWFYLGREGLSIVENYGKMGLPLPSFLTGLLAQLKKEGDTGEAPHENLD